MNKIPLSIALTITLVFTGCHKKTLWEYKVVESYQYKAEIEQELLKKNGAQGWELVSGVPTSFIPAQGPLGDEKLRSICYYFKRPIEK